jgi:hypothetical protein
MRALPLLLLMICCQAPPASMAEVPATSRFDQHFTGRTLSVHYTHRSPLRTHDSTAMEEPEDTWLAPLTGRDWLKWKELRIDSTWAGPRTTLLDPTDSGKYRLELRELATRELMYSRGFCSIYGEWETTPEAREREGRIQESARIPEPRRPALLTIQRRDEGGEFRDLGWRNIDPGEARSDGLGDARKTELVPIFVHGDPATHVDLLVASDGYARGERDKFLADTRRLVGALFDTEPFRRRKSDFNVRALFVATPFDTSGIDNPRAGIGRETNFGMSYNAFGSDRYVLAMDDRALREACAQSPYDTLILLFNEKKYGGGGIYNLWATCAADTEPAPYVFVHEFGHSFAGLADEYYSSQVAYEDFVAPGVEPWEPNVTALLDPSKLKWKDLVESSTPLPTPWDKPRFDALDLSYQAKRAELLAAGAGEETMEALFREVKASTGPLLAAEKFAGKVGAFEGACYQAKGLYRPSADCIMFTRNPTSFCRVCERALERTIDSYVK